MKLTAQNLEEILEIAKESVEEGDDCFNYKVGGYDLFIFCDFGLDDEEYWVVEPNRIDENGCSEPSSGWNEVVDYKDYDALLVACERLAERYFEEV